VRPNGHVADSHHAVIRRRQFVPPQKFSAVAIVSSALLLKSNQRIELGTQQAKLLFTACADVSIGRIYDR
jgi:hypothetical protein